MNYIMRSKLSRSKCWNQTYYQKTSNKETIQITNNGLIIGFFLNLANTFLSKKTFRKGLISNLIVINIKKLTPKIIHNLLWINMLLLFPILKLILLTHL